MQRPGRFIPVQVYSLVIGKDPHSLHVLCWYLVSHSGSSVRTVSVLPVRRGFERSRWRCVCGTRFTIWSASSVPPARSTSVWVTAICSSTQTLCASRTSLSGPNSTITTWFSKISCSRRASPCLFPLTLQGTDCWWTDFLQPAQALSCIWHS